MRKRKYTDEQLLDYLREYIKLKGVPTYQDLKINKFYINGIAPNSSLLAKRFGTFLNSLSKIGITNIRKRINDEIDDDYIEKFKNRVKEYIQLNDYQTMYDFFPHSEYVKFGGIKNGMKAIGEDYEKIRTLSLKRKLKIDYINLCVELNKKATAIDITNKGECSFPTYKKYFGSMDNLHKECQSDIEKFDEISLENKKKTLIKKLQYLAAKIGRTPQEKELSNYQEMPCYATYERAFGSWTNALQAAGLRCENSYYTDRGRLCWSYLEYKFYSMLEKYNIPFETEVAYKKFINTKRRFRFDAVVNINSSLYPIEIFGYKYNEKYLERKKYKIQMCKDNDINLISFNSEEVLYTDENDLYLLLLNKIA